MENKKKLIIFVADSIFNNGELLFSISIFEELIKYKGTIFLHGKSMAKTYIEGWTLLQVINVGEVSIMQCRHSFFFKKTWLGTTLLTINIKKKLKGMANLL
jgi:hypothetical protein